MRISSIPYFDNPSYLYNGKELDMMSGLNSYDYGARQYYSVLPVWDRVDPLCEKFYHISPYAYCMNNPVNAFDPNGMYPVITITAQKSGGTTWQQVYGYPNLGNTMLLTRVPLYTATVTDTEDKDFSYSFTVTRDAYSIKKGDSDGKNAIMSNCCYEPTDDQHDEFGAGVDYYPYGTDLPSLGLLQDGTKFLDASPNQSSVDLEYREIADLASGVRLHVGGIYEAHGKLNYAGSLACFGIAKDDKTPSNEYTKEVMGVITDLMKKADGKVKIIVVPRNSNDIPNNVSISIQKWY